MCNTSLHTRGFNNTVDPFPFSTFHLLRTCNRLMLPASDAHSYYNMIKESNSTAAACIDNRTGHDYNATFPTPSPANSPILDVMETMPLADEAEPLSDINSNGASLEENKAIEKSTCRAQTSTDSENPTPNGSSVFRSSGPLSMNLSNISVGSSLLNSKSPLPSFEYIAPPNHPANTSDFPLMELNRVGVFPGFLHRRPRGEKRPIPDEQKDEKYYERRKRNNEAAKKSRDARKIREDRIAFRAALLEQENSILRAQVMAMRDELQTMRQLISTTSATVAGMGVTQL